MRRFPSVPARRLLTAAAITAAGAFAAAPAQAQMKPKSPKKPTGPAVVTTKEVVVPSTLVVANGPSPTDPGNCSAGIFAQWTDTGQVVRSAKATAVYASGRQDTNSVEGPAFHDKLQYVHHYNAPAGSHWVNVSMSWADGLAPDDCSVMAERYRTEWLPGAKVTVTLTVEVDPKQCEKSRKTRKSRAKSVSKLKAQHRKAKGSKKKKLAKQLATARERLASSREREKLLC